MVGQSKVSNLSAFDKLRKLGVSSEPLPHSALSWIFNEVENLASVARTFNLAQLVSPSVSLPAEHVISCLFKHELE